ncbi:hypothetical protein F66182_6123 [Fusarium sp. NRRL 66182]|nr:hypothetical protein F66182_6123 [Fusarium sp. NRRL 66182]
MPINLFQWGRHSNTIPHSVGALTQPVAGRRERQCSQPRDRLATQTWLADGRAAVRDHTALDAAQQEVRDSPSQSSSPCSRLGRWWDVEASRTPVADIRPTHDREAHGLPIFFTSTPSLEDAYAHESAGLHAGVFVPEPQSCPDSPSSTLATAGSPLWSSIFSYPSSPVSPSHFAFPTTQTDATPDTGRWPFPSPPSSTDLEEYVDDPPRKFEHDYEQWGDAFRSVRLVTGGAHEAVISSTATFVNTPASEPSGPETLVATPKTLSLAVIAAFADEVSEPEEEYPQEGDEEIEEDLVVQSVRITRPGRPALVDISHVNRCAEDGDWELVSSDLGQVFPFRPHE